MFEAPKIQWPLILASAVVVLGFVAAYLDPIGFWGMNFHTYLSPGIVIGAVLAAMGLAGGMRYVVALPLGKVPHWVWAALAAFGMGLLFYAFPIQTDLYGDSHVILKTLEKGGRDAEHYSLLGAFSPRIFSSKNGEQFTYSLAVGMGELLGLKVQASFRLLATGFGMLWVYGWVWFVLRRLQSRRMRVLGVFLGLSAGISQLFYGHVEVYAAPVLAFTLYLIALVEWLDGRKRGWFIALTVLLLLSLRTHSAGFALVPTYGYACMGLWVGENIQRKTWLSWRRLGWLILAGTFLAGAVAYFSVFDAGIERGEVTVATRSPFLSLLGNRTPDNRYPILDLGHFWDVGQEMLLCSAVGCAFLLTLAWLRLRSKIAWDLPSEIGATMAFILLGGLIFVIDPALSMPRDWDLCGLAAPALLVVTLLFLRRIEQQATLGWITLALLLVIGGLQLTFIPLNYQPRPLHLRIIDLGNRAFWSQHTGSSFMVRNALANPCFSRQEREQRLQEEVNSWKPVLNSFNGADVGYLSLNLAAMKFEGKNYADAATYYALAAKGTPEDPLIQEDLAVSYYYLQDWNACFSAAQKAISLHATKSTAWQVSFVAAAQMGQEQVALQIGHDFLARFGDVDGMGREVAALEQRLAGR